MIKYLGKKYHDINHLAAELKISMAMANHLYVVNGGKCDDKEDLKVRKGFKVEKVKLNTKEDKIAHGKEDKDTKDV